jgi:hypothetical protein
MRWSSDLHHLFLLSTKHLESNNQRGNLLLVTSFLLVKSGSYISKFLTTNYPLFFSSTVAPVSILKAMREISNVPITLTRHQVASHLQKHRNDIRQLYSLDAVGYPIETSASPSDSASSDSNSSHSASSPSSDKFWNFGETVADPSPDPHYNRWTPPSFFTSTSSFSSYCPGSSVDPDYCDTRNPGVYCTGSCLIITCPHRLVQPPFAGSACHRRETYDTMSE